MAYTHAQLSALETAIAQGVLSVQYDDRRVTYHTLAEMLRLRNTLRAELGIAAPASARSRFVQIATGKGL